MRKQDSRYHLQVFLWKEEERNGNLYFLKVKKKGGYYGYNGGSDEERKEWKEEFQNIIELAQKRLKMEFSNSEEKESKDGNRRIISIRDNNKNDILFFLDNLVGKLSVET